MRGEYSTRQKRELLKFLKEHELENFSVDEVVLRLRERGASVGRSTAYRYLEALAEQGSVRKYAGAQGITQYQSVSDSDDCSRHFHMLCKRCGTLMHVDCGLMESLSRLRRGTAHAGSVTYGAGHGTMSPAAGAARRMTHGEASS